ncbi:MAG: tRNA (adenosine(37)-N6)-threonylcarbamoyltransferase complex dimerization subunit type 1 TsaB [Acidiferrobacterales bacterium]|nr:tRNA (adenosine(37)-N6)-threonylcarbamoyltransferase complex dimerization subunit type 1 TsaB [Acidiferrobacterales bacterium]
MKVLAISCADRLLSVSLNIDGEIITKRQPSNRDQNNSVLVLVSDLLSETQMVTDEIDAVAYGKGPGSYTGLRIAAGVAQGIAFGSEIPALPVSNLAAIAQGLSHDKAFIVMDAKRNKLFVGAYERNPNGIVEPVCEDGLFEIQDVQLIGKNWKGAGNGWDLRHQELEQRFADQVDSWEANRQPCAEQISILGMNYLRCDLGVDAYLALPNYLSPYFSN